VLSAIAALLGIAVVAMSQVSGPVGLLVGVTFTRGLGQTSLSIVSLAMVGKWFQRRLTWAMGVYSLAMSVGFMIAFPVVGAVVLAQGWRTAWAAIGVALVAGLAPLSLALVRATPETIGETMDGDRRAGGSTAHTTTVDATDRRRVPSATLAEALRSPAFWVFGLASTMYGLVASGIGLFNEAILAERGFEPSTYHTALAVTAITGLAGNIVAGVWAERASFRPVLVTSMAMLAAGLAALPHVTTTPHVMAQAVVMGMAGGFVMVVFFSFWGRAFGDAHLGRIQGAAQVMTVLGSAIGPLALAWCVEVTGSYAFAFYVIAAIVAALGLSGTIVRLPGRV
jgi:MFS family permease